MSWVHFVGILTLIGVAVVQYPQNVYEHSTRRDWLKQEELENSVQLPVLNEDEQIVDQYLQYLKWKEFKATEQEFRPARPIEQEMDNIVASDVYEALRSLPKGGIMHTHENHDLSKETQLRLIWESDQFQYLHIVNGSSTDSPWKLDFYDNPPDDDDWILVKDSEYTFEEILEQQTLISILTDRATNYPSDSGERWRQMGPLWGRGSTQLIANIHIKRLYLEALYNQTMAEGAQYLESRKNFGPEEGLYEIDTSGNSSATNGKKYFDNRDGELEIELTQQIINEYQQRFPNFIGHRRIIYSSRFLKTYEEIKVDMDRAIALHTKYPNHIVGYDLVSEEDRGNSLLAYIDNFVDLYQDGGSKIPLYLHTAESNWPSDLITSPDNNEPVGTVENIYDAILLGARRFGHGLGFIKHPQLLNDIIEKDLAIEVCPVSNQVLGFTPDIRVHPALTYYRKGVPIVLGSDDPGTFGYDSFTIDWYEIFMAWGLTLADLKKLADNSLRYSSMTPDEYSDAVEQQWTPEWSRYIAYMKEKACNTDFTANTPIFSRVIPNKGARFDATTVHIYGRNFERAICKTVTCTFGSVQSPLVTYVTNNHITCQAPVISSTRDPIIREIFHSKLLDEIFAANEVTTEVTIDLGDGVKHKVGNFTYVFDTLEPPNDTGSTYSPVFIILFICTALSFAFMGQ